MHVHHRTSLLVTNYSESNIPKCSDDTFNPMSATRQAQQRDWLRLPKYTVSSPDTSVQLIDSVKPHGVTVLHLLYMSMSRHATPDNANCMPNITPCMKVL